jgi:hypothetical protein
VQGSIVGAVLLAVGRGPAEKARAEASASSGAAGGSAKRPAGDEEDDAAPASTWYSGHPPPDQPPHAPDEEDWVPPPHAVPFGPFLALAALEVLLAGEALFNWYFGALQRLFG